MSIEETIENLEGEMCDLSYCEEGNKTIIELEGVIKESKSIIYRLKGTKTNTQLSAEYVDSCITRLNLVINAARNRISELVAIQAEIIGIIY